MKPKELATFITYREGQVIGDDGRRGWCCGGVNCVGVVVAGMLYTR